MTVLVHAGHDEYYTVHHSRILHAKLKALNAPYNVYMEIPMMPHAFEISEHSIASQMYRIAFHELLQKIINEES